MLRMSKVTLGLVGSRAYAAASESLARHIALVGEAAAKGAQIVCLQELFRTAKIFCKGEVTDRS